MEKGDNRGMLEGKDQQMCLGGGQNRNMRGLNRGEKFLARAGSRRRGSCVCFCHGCLSAKVDEKQPQQWESGHLERTKRSFLSCILWRSVHFLGILLSSTLSAPAIAHGLSLLWFEWSPGHGGAELFYFTADLPAVAVLELGQFISLSFLSLVATKLPSQHFLCSVTSSHTTASQNGGLKVDSSSCSPQLFFQEQVFPKHSWEKVSICSIGEELAGLTTMVVEVLLQEWAFILLIITELLLVISRWSKTNNDDLLDLTAEAMWVVWRSVASWAAVTARWTSSGFVSEELHEISAD